MKLFTTTTEIKKAIASISNRGKKLDLDIHIAGVSCLAHVAEHGDTTVLDSLVQALPKGSRKNAFVAWCLEFGNVRLLEKENTKEASAIAQGRIFTKYVGKAVNIEGAIAQSWTTFKPEQDIHTAFDLGSSTKRLVQQYTKAVKSGTDIKGNEQAIKDLKALLQSLEVQGASL